MWASKWFRVSSVYRVQVFGGSCLGPWWRWRVSSPFDRPHLIETKQCFRGQLCWSLCSTWPPKCMCWSSSSWEPLDATVFWRQRLSERWLGWLRVIRGAPHPVWLVSPRDGGYSTDTHGGMAMRGPWEKAAFCKPRRERLGENQLRRHLGFSLAAPRLQGFVRAALAEERSLIGGFGDAAQFSFTISLQWERAAVEEAPPSQAVFRNTDGKVRTGRNVLGQWLKWYFTHIWKAGLRRHPLLNSTDN